MQPVTITAPAPVVRRRLDLPAVLLAPVVAVAYHVVIVGLLVARSCRRLAGR